MTAKRERNLYQLNEMHSLQYMMGNELEGVGFFLALLRFYTWGLFVASAITRS